MRTSRQRSVQHVYNCMFFFSTRSSSECANLDAFTFCHIENCSVMEQQLLGGPNKPRCVESEYGQRYNNLLNTCPPLPLVSGGLMLPDRHNKNPPRQSKLGWRGALGHYGVKICFVVYAALNVRTRFQTVDLKTQIGFQSNFLAEEKLSTKNELLNYLFYHPYDKKL